MSIKKRKHNESYNRVYLGRDEVVTVTRRQKTLLEPIDKIETTVAEVYSERLLDTCNGTVAVHVSQADGWDEYGLYRLEERQL